MEAGARARETAQLGGPVPCLDAGIGGEQYEYSKIHVLDFVCRLDVPVACICVVRGSASII